MRLIEGDTMLNKTARLMLIAALLLTAANWFYARRAKAAPQLVLGQPQCKSFVPLEWGEYKGSSNSYGVAFQDSKGTLRFITNVSCQAVPSVALEIQRGMPSN
jgi:hypothetical protein